MNKDSIILLLVIHGIFTSFYYHVLIEYIRYMQNNLFLKKFTQYIKDPEAYFDTSIRTTFILQTMLLIIIGIIPFLNVVGFIYLQNNIQELKFFSKKTIKYLNNISPFRKILFKRISPLIEIYSLDVKIKKILLDQRVELRYFNEIYDYSLQFQTQAELVYSYLSNDYFKFLKNPKNKKLRQKLSNEIEVLDVFEKNFRDKIYYINNRMPTMVSKIICDEIYNRLGINNLFTDIQKILEIDNMSLYEIQKDLEGNINLAKREKL